MCSFFSWGKVRYQVLIVDWLVTMAVLQELNVMAFGSKLKSTHCITFNSPSLAVEMEWQLFHIPLFKRFFSLKVWLVRLNLIVTINHKFNTLKKDIWRKEGKSRFGSNLPSCFISSICQTVVNWQSTSHQTLMQYFTNLKPLLFWLCIGGLKETLCTMLYLRRPTTMIVIFYHQRPCIFGPALEVGKASTLPYLWHPKALFCRVSFISEVVNAFIFTKEHNHKPTHLFRL